jgi:hypothetical protein
MPRRLARAFPALKLKILLWESTRSFPPVIRFVKI